MTMKHLAVLFGIAILSSTLTGCGGSGSGTQMTGSNGAITGRAVNEAGQPIKGATVQLMPANRSVRRAIITTTTDVNGHFVLNNVAAGSYTVSVSTTSTNGTPVDVQVTVTVPAGTTIDLTITVNQTASVTSPSTGSITGRVTDAQTGAVVSGALVTAKSSSEDDGPELKTFTATDGTFRFDTLPAGLWVLVASKQDFSSSRVLADVTAGVVSEVDLTISQKD